MQFKRKGVTDWESIYEIILGDMSEALRDAISGKVAEECRGWTSLFHRHFNFNLSAVVKSELR